jgi:hypothetical protein
MSMNIGVGVGIDVGFGHVSMYMYLQLRRGMHTQRQRAPIIEVHFFFPFVHDHYRISGTTRKSYTDRSMQIRSFV